MMFLTNGTAQELPQDQQFDFWKTQDDWGRAIKVAKIRQVEVLGPAVAPHYEFLLNVLLEAVSADPRYSFTSRPRGQAVDWCRWAEFCRWFFGHNAYDQQIIMDQLRRGEVYAWYPTFAGWAASDGSFTRYCCESDQKVDQTVFWDFHEFDRKYCQSKRVVPETFPTPDEIAEFGKLIEWATYKFGPDVTKQLSESPPNAADRSASFQPTSQPTPVEEEEPFGTPTTGSVLAVAGIAAAVVLGIGLLVYSVPQRNPYVTQKRREESRSR